MAEIDWNSAAEAEQAAIRELRAYYAQEKPRQLQAYNNPGLRPILPSIHGEFSNYLNGIMAVATWLGFEQLHDEASDIWCELETAYQAQPETGQVVQGRFPKPAPDRGSDDEN